MVCYDTLRSGGLLPKLSRARDVVQKALADPFAKERLADGLAVHKQIDSKRQNLSGSAIWRRKPSFC
jgi:hypothetical protein